MKLEEIIIEKIKEEDAISFRDFMEMCLYYPDLGFYTSPGSSVGPNGSFYTSAYITPIFGAMIGRQMVEMWQTLGCHEFTVVEYGAGTGILCHDILSYLKDQHPKMYDGLSYGIIEKSHFMRQIEKKHLTEKVVWYDSIKDIPMLRGCIFSNELVDNFSVNLVVMDDELMEVYVTHDAGFKEVLQPACSEVKEYFSELGLQLPKGFRTEVNLEVPHWMEEVSKVLQEGYVMTIDYGYLSNELYKPSKSQGTLLCYYDHTVNDNYFTHIGEQDITSHVNFSAIEHWGQKYGLKECWFMEQCQFLLNMGFNDYLNQTFSKETDIVQAAKKASIIRHKLLFDMGSKFKVLLQQKE